MDRASAAVEEGLPKAANFFGGDLVRNNKLVLKLVGLSLVGAFGCSREETTNELPAE